MGNITYIDRSNFDRTMQERYCFNCERKGNYPIFGVACKTCWVMNMLEEIELFPAADAVEARHGKWHDVYQMSSDCIVATCSSCGNSHAYCVNGLLNFCPNCGADMREVQE